MIADNKPNPPFAFPAMFAVIAGISAKEVRRLCQQHIIPSEKTRKGFRIDVEAGLAVLRERAATFVGHPPMVYHTNLVQQPRKINACSSKDFLSKLDALKGKGEPRIDEIRLKMEG